MNNMKPTLRLMPWSEVFGKDGTLIPWDECLEIQDHEKPRHWPIMPIRMTMKPRQVRPGEYHVTEVLNPRLAFYDRTQGYAADIAENMWLFLGVAVHRAIQEGYPVQYRELRVFSRYDDGTVVTGSVDVVDPYSHSLLELKTSGNVAFLVEKMKRPNDMHVKQGSCYWWMLQNTFPKLAKTVRNEKIIYLSKNAKDIQYHEFVSGEDYEIIPWETLAVQQRKEELHTALLAGTPPMRLCYDLDVPQVKPFVTRAKYPCTFCRHAAKCAADFAKQTGTR